LGLLKERKMSKVLLGIIVYGGIITIIMSPAIFWIIVWIKTLKD
jgi:hypothetical protein